MLYAGNVGFSQSLDLMIAAAREARSRPVIGVNIGKSRVVDADDAPAVERDYLLAFASRYFAKPVTAGDVVWSYAGVRPLYNDGASSATSMTPASRPGPS